MLEHSPWLKLLLLTPFLATLAGLLGACTTTPESGPAGDRATRPDRVAAEPDAFQGRTMEWGGLVIATRNFKEHTELEIMGLPLEANGRPLRTQPATSRFIAIRPGYIETAEYTTGRLVTVVGSVIGVRSGHIGAAGYRYPEIEIKELYLWPENTSRRESPDVRFSIGAGSWGGGVGIGIGF